MNTKTLKPPTFNLIDEPWIPCIDLTGERHELSLAMVLAEAHLLREIAGESPPVTVALHRLLLAIMLCAYGLQNEREWEKLWAAGELPNAPLDSYLDRWRARFDLFDPQRPFMQVADERVKPKSVATLMLDIGSGNNATLFDHHMDADGLSVNPSTAARALITAQLFGLPGRSSFSEQNHTSGVCVGGVIFFVEGDNLFETLMLNCFYPENRFIPTGINDRPAWEMDDPLLPKRTGPIGYLDYLTWHNRLILLVPEVSADGVQVKSATIGPGLQLEPLPLDPMKSYRPNKELGLVAIAFDEDRAVWRDSTALFRFHNSIYRPPQALDSLSNLVFEN